MGEVVRVRKEKTSGTLIKFTPKKTVKLRKDGQPKETPCNTKHNRDNVYPFKEEDVPRMVDALKDKIESSKNSDDRMTFRRYLALFIMGINIGLRASDLLALKWCQVYDKDWNFLDGIKIKPIKTERTNKHVFLKYNDSFRKAIEEYRQYYNPTNLNAYIFESREKDSKKSKKNSKGKETKKEWIEVQTAGKYIKNVAKSIGIKYNVNSHSMRKTFARTIYDHSPDKEAALIGIGIIFGHSSLKITRDYLCITEEEIDRLYNMVNLGYEIIEE